MRLKVGVYKDSCDTKIEILSIYETGFNKVIDFKCSLFGNHIFHESYHIMQSLLEGFSFESKFESDWD